MRFSFVSLCSLLWFAVFSPTSAAAANFEVQNSIVINAPAEAVFCFAGNPENDAAWRSEVNDMTADGPWAEGTLYYEDSTLGLNKHYLTITELEELDYPNLMIVQTPADSLFLRAERSFETLANGKTRFTYKLIVDVRMPLAATGLPVPPLLAKLYYGQVMRNYQAKLKQLLEAMTPAELPKCAAF